MGLQTGPAVLTASGSPALAHRANRPTRAIGRPSLLTPEVQESILTDVRDGVPPETAMAKLGINGNTFYTWKDRGKLDYESGDDTIFASFYVNIKEALAHFESKLAKKWAKIVTEPTTKRRTIYKSAPNVITGGMEQYVESDTVDATGDGDWRGIAEYLARRYPERWMRTERVEQSGVNGKPIEVRNSALPVELDKIDIDVKRRVIALLEGVASGDGNGSVNSNDDIMDAVIEEIDDSGNIVARVESVKCASSLIDPWDGKNAECDYVSDMPIPARYRV